MVNSPTVAVRLSPDGLRWVEQTAASFGVNKTVVLRAMFTVASRHPGEIETLLKEARDGRAGEL